MGSLPRFFLVIARWTSYNSVFDGVGSFSIAPLTPIVRRIMAERKRTHGVTRFLGLGLTPGKLRGLQRVSNANGTLTMVALDKLCSSTNQRPKDTRGGTCFRCFENNEVVGIGTYQAVGAP